MTTTDSNTIAIIGGGLAGMAAALRLREHGLHVELFEARRALGGRAASYRDSTSGELIDHCQHVSMACCTNFADFCHRTGIADDFERYHTLHFFDAEGRRSDLQASRWLPAPLHLGPSFLRMGFLPWRDRLRTGLVMLRLARTTNQESAQSPTIGQWLREQGVSTTAIERFWSVVLVSALGETIERASLAAARKVFVDGFLAHRAGYAVEIPHRSLRELCDERVASHLEQAGVVLHRYAPLSQLQGNAQGVRELELATGERRKFTHYLLAVPWRKAFDLLTPELQAALPHLKCAQQFGSSPISGVHLWFDRPLTPLPHAVLVDRLTQWLFRREIGGAGHYYQAVISASRDLSSMPSEEVVATVVSDIQAVFPAAREAKLLSSKLVTEREAVFSYRPGLDSERPTATTKVNNLFLAGDWTATAWPATLEGAVRSGYLAAEAILRATNHRATLLAPDLPRGWLTRWCW